MTYVAPKIVASFSADAVLTEAAASAMGAASVGVHRNATVEIVGGTMGAGLLGDVLSSH